MPKVNLKLVIALCMLFSFQLNAQVDNEKKSIPIPAEETKKKDSLPPDLKIKPNEKASITKGEKHISGIPYKSKVEVKELKNEFSMIDDNKLLNPGTIFEKRWNKTAVDQAIKPASMDDVFLGDFRVNGKFVNIICRDHQFPDGDRVRVYVNDDIIIPSLVLTSNYKSFNIPLVDGFNKVVFLALNQGESGPNTAEFQVYDDKGNLVSSKQWNLLTGVKATIIVTKEAEE